MDGVGAALCIFASLREIISRKGAKAAKKRNFLSGATTSGHHQ